MELIDFKEQYKQDLKDPRWKAMVRRIRYRDNDRCRICGCKKRIGMEMNVHHIHYYPNRKPWEYDESDLITLCRDCHIKEHDRINFEKLEKKFKLIQKMKDDIDIDFDFSLERDSLSKLKSKVLSAVGSCSGSCNPSK